MTKMGPIIATNVAVLLGGLLPPNTSYPQIEMCAERNARSRAWCFTINNPDSKPSFDGKQEYLVYQLERGLEGTEHYQGFVYFKQPKAFSQMKKWLPTAHLEVAKSISGSIEYCQKADTRIDGPWESGEKPQQGRRSDLEAVAEQVLEGVPVRELARSNATAFVRYHRGLQALRAATATPRSALTECVCIVGPTNVGKTTWVLEQYPKAYWKPPLSKWWDNYDQEDVVVIDEFTGWLPIEFMLRLLDRTPLLVENKGGVVNFAATKVFLLSNKYPEEWYPENPLLPSLLRRMTQMVKYAKEDEPLLRAQAVQDELDPLEVLLSLGLDEATPPLEWPISLE